MCISESYVQAVSTQQWPRWCFQQKGFMNTQWHRNLCLVISKRRLVQIDFQVVYRALWYRDWKLSVANGSHSSTHYASKPLFHMKTKDFWDITPYRLVVTNASKDRNALVFGVQQSNKRLLRRLDLENETVYQFTRCDISEVLNLQPQLYENLKSLVLSHFHFWLLKAAANRRSNVPAFCLSLR
jgi:hypothetical protein